MSERTSKRLLPAAATVLVLGACADGTAPTAPAARPALARAAATATVVMQNLNSPKGLEFGPEGALYVAETGTAEKRGPCISAGDQGGGACLSGTGSVSRYWKGRQERVAVGLPSLADEGGRGPIAGPQDVSFQGRGNMYVTIGLGADPALRARLGAPGLTLGTLVRVQPNGRWEVAADVAGVEAARNPDQGAIDSNPYGVLADAGRQYVTDAGGNSLVEVRTNGQRTPIAVFPSRTLPPLPPGFPPFTEAEAVPTGVTRGPDGALYVGTLTGVPFAPGLAAVYRVVPGSAPQLFRDGFTAITDLAFGPGGVLYVLQHASGCFLSGPGAVIRVAPDGTRTTLAADLVEPTGIAVGPDGAVYVTNRGTSNGGGEVLRLAP